MPDQAGCKVIFDADECRVYYGQKLVLSGKRDTQTGLWKVPINPTFKRPQVLPHLDLEISNRTSDQMYHMAANVYTLPFKQQQLKFIHQVFSIHRSTR
jgi:hypothetical protein